MLQSDCRRKDENHLPDFASVLVTQGFGNVGAWAAEIFEEHGGKVLAVSDANSAIFNEKGLDIVALRRHVASKQPLSIFPEGDNRP